MVPALPTGPLFPIIISFLQLLFTPLRDIKCIPKRFPTGKYKRAVIFFKIKARFSRGLTLEMNLSAGRREQVAGTPVVPGAVPVNCASFSPGCRGAGV